MPTTFEQELAREQNATETVGKIKNRIKRVAEDKGFVVEETDTPMTVLSKLYTGTIATPTETISITENGTVDVTNYASVNVNVPSEEPTLGTKTITANGTYNASDDNLDGYSSVTVNVTGGSSKFASLVDGSITQVTTKDLSGVTSIKRYAFSDCSALTSVTIPESVGSIGYYAFYSCNNLKEVTLPTNDSFNTINSYTFYGCSSLTTITIPSTVTSIREQAFYNCSSLTSIDIPSSVISIGSYAFSNCSALKKVNITDIDAWAIVYFENNYANPLSNSGAGLYLNGELVTQVTLTTATEIGDYAFLLCSNLTSIDIPSSVTRIGNFAFTSCTALETITFGENSQLESIGDYAFFGCTSLSEITILAETPPTIQTNTFQNVPDTAIYYVPDASVDAYKTATNWSTLATQIQPLSLKPTT